MSESNRAGYSIAAPSGAPGLPQLLAKHERAIRRYVTRRSGALVLSRASVDDIFQESAARAISSSSTFCFCDDRSFLAWMFTIVRRVISGLFKDGRAGVLRIKGAYSTGVGVFEETLNARMRTPSSLVARDEGTSSLQQALRTLPPLHREIVQLYKLDRWPLAEVAERIGRSEGQTCRIAAQAMATLRLRMIHP